MTNLIFILLIVLFIIGLAAHFLSTQLHRRLIRKGKPNARTYRIAAFTLSFLVILAIILLVGFLTNVKFIC